MSDLTFTPEGNRPCRCHDVTAKEVHAAFLYERTGILVSTFAFIGALDETATDGPVNFARLAEWINTRGRR